MRPLYFATHEGDVWQRWPGGSINRKKMPKRGSPLRVPGGPQYRRQGVTFHALLFADGQVWDAVNAWRTTANYSRKDLNFLERWVKNGTT